MSRPGTRRILGGVVGKPCASVSKTDWELQVRRKKKRFKKKQQ
jgi:hypothetical protein